MAFDCELPDGERLEMILLSIWYRARHGPGYRRRDETVLGSTVDPITGIELSEADLRAPGEAIQGPDFVFSCPVMPDRLAEECLLRDEVDGSKPSLAHVLGWAITTDQPDLSTPGTTKPVVVFRCPSHELGRAEEELLQIRKQHPEWNAKIRRTQGREAWTAEEASAHAELQYRFQVLLLKWAQKGFVSLTPPLAFTSDTGHTEEFARGVDDQSMPYCCTVLPAGLDEAERRIAGHPLYSQGAHSSLEAMSGEMKARVMATSPWASKKHQREGGTS